MASTGAGEVCLAGSTASFGQGGLDVALVVVDGTGTVAQQKAWGDAGDERANAIILRAGAPIMAGETTSFGAGQKDALLLSLDALWGLVRQEVWGGALDDRATGIVADGTDSLLVGTTENFGGGGSDGVLLRFDSGGNLSWEKTWGGGQDDAWCGIGIDASGDFFIAGESGSIGPLPCATLSKLDSSGSLLWDKAYDGGTEGSRAYGMMLSATGALLLVGEAPQATLDWSVPTLALSDASGTHSVGAGTLINIGGLLADQTGTEDSPAGTEDSGAGGADALISRLGPGL
jgi:hypothetical protein